MKKRIVSILLALSVFCFSFSHNPKRSYAAVAGVLVCAAACVAAVSMMQYATSGQYEKDAEKLIDFINSAGEEANFIINGETITDENGNTYHNSSYFQSGFGVISKKVQELFDNGDLVVDDNNYVIKGDKFHSLIKEVNQSISVMSRPKVDFTSGYNCMFLDVDLSKPFDMKNLPLISEFFLTSSGQAFAAVYFNETRIVFSQYFLYMQGSSVLNERASRRVGSYFLSDSYKQNSLSPGTLSSAGTLDDFYNFKVSLNMSLLSNFGFSYYSAGSQKVYENSVDYCFVYENGTVTYTPISDVDVGGMNSGLVTTTGDYGAFLQSIDDYSISTEDVPKLDDLSGVVPDDATLSIPVNPDKDKPIAEQVGVSVPGVGDFTLAELQGDLNLDISVPSTIITKFPFCIPFDFARFLGILCADPVAPVFRIPISTHPDNLEQWASNETIGEYIDPDSPPLFEIDEEIVIDLSHIPLVQPICYTCFIVGFIFLLLHITPKMIQH
ncbi:MAG: hypothetical protein HDT42_03190 [Ruminococcaceae bacterium]|nr:hypothetical protein [Oscillospiraceae bacterium]